MKTKRRARLVAAVAAPFLALGSCELAARAGWIGPGPRPSVEGLVVQTSPIEGLGVEPAPGALRTTTFRDTRCSPPRTVLQRTNALGLRGADVAIPKPDGVARIVCVGDSHTFGDGVADDETWPAFLEAELRRRGGTQRVEVVNAGVNGYDTEQELLFTRHRLLALEPDVLVLQYFINDLGSRSLEQVREHHPHWSHPRRPGALAAVRRHSALVDAIAETVFRRRHLADMADWLTQDLSADAPKWRFTRARLREFASLAEEARVDLLVALYPLMQAHGDGLASDASFDEVGRFLASAGIPYVDASPAFRGRDVASLRVAPGDMHAGARAHRIFAGVVAERLVGLGL